MPYEQGGLVLRVEGNRQAQGSRGFRLEFGSKTDFFSIVVGKAAAGEANIGASGSALGELVAGTYLRCCQA